MRKTITFFTVFILIFFVIIPMLNFSALADPDTKTWTNGNGTNIWNDAANWDPSGVPGSSDDVVFDGTYTADCNIDISPIVKSLVMQSGYSGTVSLGSNTLTINGDFTISGGTFNSGTGKVKFADGTSTVTIGSTQLYDVQFAQGTYSNIEIVGELSINNDLTVSGVQNINGGNINVLGNIVTTDSKVGGTSTIKLTGTHTINADGQSGELSNLLIESGSVDASDAGSVGVQSFTMTGGTFSAPSTTMYVSGDFDVDSSATFVHNNDLIIFDGGGAKTIDTDSSMSNTLYDIYIAVGSWSSRTIFGTVYMDNDLTLKGSSSCSIDGGTIDVAGNVVATTYMTGTATIHMNGAHTINAGGQSGGMPNLHVTGGTVDASGGTVVQVRDLILDGGTFTAPKPGRLEIKRDFSISSGVFTHNDGTVKFFNGSGSVSIGSTHLYDVIISMSSWSGLTVSSEMHVEGDLTIAGSPSSKLPSGTIKVEGDVITTNNGFSGAGTIEFVGAYDQTLGAAGGTGQLPKVEIIKSGGTLIIEDTIEVVGSWTFTSGNVDAGTSTVVIQNGSKPIDSEGMAFYNFKVKLSSWAGLTIVSDLDVNGDFEMASTTSSKLIMEHGGADINVLGDVTLTSGKLQVNVNSQSTSDNLITYGGTQTGTFTSVTLQNNANSLVFDYGDGSDDTISLLGSNIPPIADINGPYSGSEGSTISFDASGSSDPDGDPLTYAWDLDNDGEYDDATGVTASASWCNDGTYMIGLKVTDDDGESDTDTTQVSVNNVAPIPDAGEDKTGDEISTFTFTGSHTDPGCDSWIYEWDFNYDGITFNVDESGNGVINTWNDDFDGYVALRISDDDESNIDTCHVTVNNVAPTITSFTGPIDPVNINDPVVVEGFFTDPGILDTHTATIDWDDETTSTGTITEEDGSKKVDGSNYYDQPGVYTITLTVTDDDEGSDSMVIDYYVVVYDPSAGFVTGGGWIMSPEGAYKPDSTLTGKANFGFISKYKKGQQTPIGNTEFQFKAGNMNFHSYEYEWLVIAGCHAKFKGSGTINGEGDFGFLLTATDGQINGGGGVDKFRIKIWDKDDGDTIVYDNKIDDDDYGTELGGGQIKIHSK
jgi:hypothetical protein